MQVGVIEIPCVYDNNVNNLYLQLTARCRNEVFTHVLEHRNWNDEFYLVLLPMFCYEFPAVISEEELTPINVSSSFCSPKETSTRN